MPIITDENGLKTVVFGTGDICMNDTGAEDGDHYNGLCFFEMKEPRVIDTVSDEFRGMKLADVKAEVHFVFNKKASVRALMNSLESLYNNMPDEGASASDSTESA